MRVGGHDRPRYRNNGSHLEEMEISGDAQAFLNELEQLKAHDHAGYAEAVRLVRSLLGLAQGQRAVGVDPQAAFGYFEKARAWSAEALRDAMAGQVRCLIEMDRPEEARRVLSEALEMFGVTDADIAALVEAIEDRVPLPVAFGAFGRREPAPGCVLGPTVWAEACGGTLRPCLEPPHAAPNLANATGRTLLIVH